MVREAVRTSGTTERYDQQVRYPYLSPKKSVKEQNLVLNKKRLLFSRHVS
jgi:hypothetical protein